MFQNKILTEKQAIDFLNIALREKLSLFTRQSFLTVDPGAQYTHNWHIDCIAEYLTACKNRDIKRLIINIPPRYLKSISVTVAWPAWLMGLDPSTRILAASYSQVLATKHSLDCRRIIQSPWYNRVFPSVELAHDENQKTRFETTHAGHRIATSVTGTAIGEGGDFLIVDDPHNPASALSDVKRETALTWFDQSFATRLNDKKNGVIVVVMQRLHTNDLTGHLLEKGGWEQLCIPAECEKKTFFQIGDFQKTYEAGEILHPEREDSKALKKVEIELGSYVYAGQYQQRPAPLGGGMCKLEWWKYYKMLPALQYCIIVADTAMKDKEQNDFSVFQLWGMGAEKNYYLIDQLRGKWEAPMLRKQFIAFWNKCKAIPEYKLRGAWIEDKASGTGLIQEIKTQSNIPIIAIKRNTKDKVSRFASVTPIIEAGYVYLPEDAPWLSDFLNETSQFPNGAHDDQVDCVSDGLDQLHNVKREFNARII